MDVVTTIGVVANVVMAVVAAMAVNTWRKQLSGESQHDLAKRLSRTLRQVAIARDEAVKNLGAVLDFETGGDNRIGALFAGGYLETNGKTLDGATSELAGLEGEVAVLWDEKLLAVIETIRKESKTLARYLAARTAATNRSENVAELIVFGTPAVAPTFTLGTYKYALDQLTNLAQLWLQPHLGRKHASFMEPAELGLKRFNIDDEVKRRAEVEKIKLEQLALEQAARDCVAGNET